MAPHLGEPTPTVVRRPGRLDSIDVLRAVAILAMILIHFVENLSADDGTFTFLYRSADILGSFAAPIFTFLVGTSFALSLDRQRRTGRTEPEIVARTVRRGLLIFFAGFAFAVIIWLPESVFDWDILTFIGASILLLCALRNRSNTTLLVIVVAIVAISPPLRELTDYSTHWNVWGEYVSDSSARSIFLGFLLHGYFPLLPWFAFPVAGMIAGRRISSQGDAPFLPVGIALIVAAVVGSLVSNTVGDPLNWYASPISFYPASTTFLLGTGGTILVAFWWLYGWLDTDPRPGGDGWLVFFRRYSRYALTVYIVHHMVHIWPLYAASWINDRGSPWYYYADAVPIPVAWMLAIVFIAVLYGALTLWDRYDGKYSFEWVLGRLID